MFKSLLLSSLLFFGCSDKKEDSKINFSPISKAELSEHCSFVEYISPICEEVRFILYHNYVIKNSCTSSNLLCTDYFGSKYYIEDYEIYKDFCSRSDQTDEVVLKSCRAYNYLLSNDLLVSPYDK